MFIALFLELIDLPLRGLTFMFKIFVLSPQFLIKQLEVLISFLHIFMQRSVVCELSIILRTQDILNRMFNAQFPLKLIEHSILFLNEFLVHTSEVFIFCLSAL